MGTVVARTVLEGNKKFYVAIQKIYGIGRASGVAVCEACGISKEMRIKDVKASYIQKVEAYIQENHIVGEQLQLLVRNDILDLIKMKSKRGFRHESIIRIHTTLGQ